jgi:hypothetical protein
MADYQLHLLQRRVQIEREEGQPPATDRIAGAAWSPDIGGFHFNFYGDLVESPPEEEVSTEQQTLLQERAAELRAVLARRERMRA